MNDIIEVEYIENTLPATWFVEGPIDFEHKVYVLMNFLKKCEENINNGFWFPDFELLAERFRDVESFLESSEIVYKRKADRELFEYLYDLPKTDAEKAEINKIANFANKVLGDIYFELNAHMEYIRANIKVINRVRDKRVKPTYFIEKCESNVVERYIVGKNDTDNLGTIFISSYDFLKNEENYVQVISDIVVDTERCLIPVAKKLIELGDCF